MTTLNFFEHVRSIILNILCDLFVNDDLIVGQGQYSFSVEPPRNPEHGDVATNVAMVFAKATRTKPHELADKVVASLSDLEWVYSAKIAGPGFINIIMTEQFWHERLDEILISRNGYGESQIGNNELINIEYVSANPTGPMHVGHGRGAVVGDVIANLLVKSGYKVTKEYYINDAGHQVEVLARSLYFRYLEALGEVNTNIPEDFYPGDYLVELAKELKKRDGDKWQDKPESVWLAPIKSFAISSMMAIIRDDLASLGVKHDVFISEQNIVKNGAVNRVVKNLEGKKLIYQGILDPPKGLQSANWEKRRQALFKATAFGDDVDRPIKKSDGSWTYFATDMGYHFDKFERGFRKMVNIWGADHGGYVKRIEAAMKAITAENGNINVRLCQMVNIFDDGKPVKMSKRSGNFISLREVVDKVGKDVVRFMMLTRKNDAQLDFDLSKVVMQSKDNPVFYVQYSHARCCSVVRQAKEMFGEKQITFDALRQSDFGHLTDTAEIALIKMMAFWPQVLKGSAESYEPHRVAYYLQDLSASFHALWAKGNQENTSLRFLSEDNPSASFARLAMVRALSIIIASGLEIIGVEPVQEM